MTTEQLVIISLTVVGLVLILGLAGVAIVASRPRRKARDLSRRIEHLNKHWRK